MEMLKKIYRIVLFLLYYSFKMIQANLSIAYDILSPVMHTKPGFVEVKLRVQSNSGILLFTNLLSMTPGTLSVGIDPGRDILLVHCLYSSNTEEVINEIEQMQDKIVKLTL